MGVTLNGKHTNEWGLTVESLEISPPEPKINKIKVPFGIDLDLSEMDGMVHYENRTIKMVLGARKSRQAWRAYLSAFLSAYHGRTVTISLDDDLGYYYYGRAQILKDVDIIARIGKFTMVVDAEPFKYDSTRSFPERTMASGATVTLPAGGIGTVPIFQVSRASADFGFSYNGKIYKLTAGRNRFPDLIVSSNAAALKFTGTGSLSIDYRRRYL